MVHEKDTLPELDPLAEDNEIQGHVAAPGLDPTPTPVTADWGETLVRQSLTDLENEMTADLHLSHGVEYRDEPEAVEPEIQGADLGEEASLPVRGH
jgi:hypothetical protein